MNIYAATDMQAQGSSKLSTIYSQQKEKNFEESVQLSSNQKSKHISPLEEKGHHGNTITDNKTGLLSLFKNNIKLRKVIMKKITVRGSGDKKNLFLWKWKQMENFSHIKWGQTTIATVTNDNLSKWSMDMMTTFMKQKRTNWSLLLGRSG